MAAAAQHDSEDDRDDHYHDDDRADCQDTGRGAPGPTTSASLRAIAVDESNGTVWACFYLTGTAKKRKLATYSCIDSRNGGQTWSRAIGGASVPSNETLHRAFNRINYVDNDYASYEGLAVSDGTAYPIWTDARRLKALREEIFTTRVRAK